MQPLQLKAKPRVGVVLDDKMGMHDGTVGGHAYFTCKPGHGMLVMPRKCRKEGQPPPRQESIKSTPPSLASEPTSDSISAAPPDVEETPPEPLNYKGKVSFFAEKQPPRKEDEKPNFLRDKEIAMKKLQDAKAAEKVRQQELARKEREAAAEAKRAYEDEERLRKMSEKEEEKMLRAMRNKLKKSKRKSTEEKMQELSLAAKEADGEFGAGKVKGIWSPTDNVVGVKPVAVSKVSQQKNVLKRAEASANVPGPNILAEYLAQDDAGSVVERSQGIFERRRQSIEFEQEDTATRGSLTGMCAACFGTFGVGPSF